jgi:hypothetical protein
MQPKAIREGFHTLTPYLLATGASRLIEFIREAFGGELIFQKERPDGAVMHAELRVGDSMLMLGEASDRFGPMPASIYLYVPDCDTVYHRALSSGGVASSRLLILLLPSRIWNEQDMLNRIVLQLIGMLC